MITNEVDNQIQKIFTYKYKIPRDAFNKTKLIFVILNKYIFVVLNVYLMIPKIALNDVYENNIIFIN